MRKKGSIMAAFSTDLPLPTPPKPPEYKEKGTMQKSSSSDALIQEITAALLSNKDEILLKLCEGALTDQALTPTALLEHLQPHHEKSPTVRIIQTAIQRKQILDKLRTGMSSTELFKTCLYIETKIAKWGQENQAVYEKSAASRPVEYTPTNKQTLIHLGQKNIKALGKGEKKTWTPSIQYRENHSEFVAELVAHTLSPIKTTKKEAAILKEVSGLPGVVKTLSVTEIPESGKMPKQFSITQKLYNGGDLGPYLVGKKKLTPIQKEAIAICITEGLSNIHEHDIVHNDLHIGQCLVEFRPLQKNGEEAHCKAVVADFDQSEKLAYSKKPPNKDWYSFDDELEQSATIEAENRDPDDKEQAAALRLLKEKSEDKISKISYYRKDIYEMAGILNLLFFDGKIPLEQLETQMKRFEIEDGLKSGKITLASMSKKDRLHYLLAKMMALPDNKAIDMRSVHRELKEILRGTA